MLRPSAAEKVSAIHPAPAPCTVTLSEPVPAWFILLSKLTVARSRLYEADLLPSRIPTETTSPLLLSTRGPVRPCIDVSETHVDPSHPVCPAAPRNDTSLGAILLPLTETLTEPVEIALVRAGVLTDPAPKDMATVTLDAFRPLVTASRWLPRLPCPIRHAADVSDTHLVPSHTVAPPTTDSDAPAPPISEPITVMLVELVAATFTLHQAARTPPSVDSPSLRLDERAPPVNAIRRLEAVRCPVPHSADVSEAHAVRSQAVNPARPAAEKPDAAPRFTPCRIILADPDDGTLARVPTLVVASSADITRVSLPSPSPAVTKIRLLLCHTTPTRHIMQVSDTQPDASHPVPPTRLATVAVLSSIRSPNTVRLVDPVAA